MMSSIVASTRRARPISPISSLASSPMMCAPRISPYGSLTITLTRPSVAPTAIALPWPLNAYLPTLYLRPFSFACFSVMPTDAICGLQ